MSACLELNLPQDEVERVAAIKKAREALNILARSDFAVFCQLVGKDERGKRVVMADIQLAIARSAQSERLSVTIACPEIGKSEIGVVLHSVWLLGRNPMTTIAVVSGTKDRAKELVSAAKRYITDDKDVAAIFPDLRPGIQWSETKIRVANCGNRPTPSLSAFGMGSKGMLGQRLDYILLDDIDNDRTIVSQVTRDAQFRYVSRVIMNRLMPGGKLLMYCNAWHCDDVAHRLIKNSYFKLFRIPIRVDHDVVKQWPFIKWTLGASIWPARWPDRRITQVLEQTLSDDERMRCYFCRPLKDGASFFKQKYFDKARELGEGLTLPQSLQELFLESNKDIDPADLEQELSYYLDWEITPRGWKREVVILHGIDLATCVGNDNSAITSIAWYPEYDFVRNLGSSQGDWETTKGLDPDDEEDDSLIGRMRRLHRNFGGTFVVENVGPQMLTVNIMSKDLLKVPVIGFPTNQYNKKFLVRAIAAMYANSQVAVPCKGGVPLDPGLDQLHAEFAAYNPADHIGDQAASALFVYGMVEALRTGKFVERGGSIQVAL